VLHAVPTWASGVVDGVTGRRVARLAGDVRVDVERGAYLPPPGARGGFVQVAIVVGGRSVRRRQFRGVARATGGVEPKKAA
jgi:hypothetical protein